MEKAERSKAIDFRQGGSDRSRARISFTGIKKRYFRQRRSGRHACIKPVLNWTNVCSPEHTSDTSTNYDSFLN